MRDRSRRRGRRARRRRNCRSRPRRRAYDVRWRGRRRRRNGWSGRQRDPARDAEVLTEAGSDRHAENGSGRRDDDGRRRPPPSSETTAALRQDVRHLSTVGRVGAGSALFTPSARRGQALTAARARRFSRPVVIGCVSTCANPHSSKLMRSGNTHAHTACPAHRTMSTDIATSSSVLIENPRVAKAAPLRGGGSRQVRRRRRRSRRTTH
jgi:hypothetical protein